MASADVVGSRVSPGLADGETALRGLSHELQLDPFAALFEVAESLPIVLAALTAVPCAHPGAHSLCPPLPLPFWHTSANKKGATWRPRLLDSKLSLYF